MSISFHKTLTACMAGVLGAGITAQQLTPLPTTADTPRASFWWGDYDGDGLEDAFVVTAQREGRLLQNRGDGTLADVTAESGLDSLAFARFALWQDVDANGTLDLFIGTAAGASQLYLGQGNGTFQESADAAGLVHAGEDLHGAFLDYDQDGRPDLHVRTRSADLLYRNLGSGVFEPVELGLGETLIASGSLESPELEPATEAAPGKRGAGLLPSEASDTIEVVSGSSAAPSNRDEVPTKSRRLPVTGGEPAPVLAPPGSSELIADCVVSIRDQSGGGCIGANSTPTLGRLYPISSNLFVASGTGYVGMNTTTPLARLDVREFSSAPPAAVRAEGALAPTRGYLAAQGQTDFDGIATLDNAGDEVGVLGISTGGSSTDNQGVLGHSNGIGVRGEYSLDPIGTFGELGTRLGVGVHASGSALAADLDGDVDILGNTATSGDLTFADDLDGITFSVSSGANTPMIQMFPSGVSNTKRLAIAHSPAFAEWGLAYDDVTDDFVFQISNASPTMTVDMGSDVTHHVPVFNLSSSTHSGTTTHNGLMTNNSTSTMNGTTNMNGPVNITHNLSSETLIHSQTALGSIGRTVEFNRTQASSAGNDLLEVEAASASSISSQIVEFQRGSDVEFRVDADGDTFCDGSFFGGGADYAEMIKVSSGAKSVEAGDLLVIDPANPRSVLKSTSASSTLVCGVYSTEPGFIGSEREWDVEGPVAGYVGDFDPSSGERVALKAKDMAGLHEEIPMAVIGIVPVKVTDEGGPIRPGDLMVTSSTPGHAMRAEDPKAGTIVGKALGSLAGGKGMIRVLVTLQ